MNSMEVDLTNYFDGDVLEKMSQFQKKSYVNKVRNYWILKELDLESDLPTFMRCKSSQSSDQVKDISKVAKKRSLKSSKNMVQVFDRTFDFDENKSDTELKLDLDQNRSVAIESKRRKPRFKNSGCSTTNQCQSMSVSAPRFSVTGISRECMEVCENVLMESVDILKSSLDDVLVNKDGFSTTEAQFLFPSGVKADDSEYVAVKKELSFADSDMSDSHLQMSSSKNVSSQYTSLLHRGKDDRDYRDVSACKAELFTDCSLQESIKREQTDAQGYWTMHYSSSYNQSECDVKTAAVRHLHYVCSHCSVHCTSRAHLVTHSQEVHSDKLYGCSLCRKSFIRKRSLLHHVEAVHMGMLYKCNDCDVSLVVDRRGLADHVRSVHAGASGNEAQNCSSMGDSDCLAVNETSEPIPEKRQSEYCGKAFTGPDDIKLHVMTSHRVKQNNNSDPENEGTHDIGAVSEHEQYACPHCSVRAISRDCLKIHMKEMHSDKLYNCSQCSKSFVTKRSLLRHVNIVHIGVRYKCNDCSATFCDKYKLSHHVRAKHASVVNSDGQRCERLENTGCAAEDMASFHLHDRHQCEYCNETFVGPDDLRLHVVIVHTAKKHNNSDRENEGHDKAVGIEDEKYACPHCSIHFKSMNCLIMHMKEMHSDKLYGCSQCSRSFLTKHKLLRHVNIVHNGIRYKCTDCSASFCDNYSLTVHTKSAHASAVHSNGQRWESLRDGDCVASDMTSVHLPERLQCDYCNEAFNGPADLKQHVLAQHEVQHCSDRHSERAIEASAVLQLQERYTCSQCNRHYACEEYLARHVLSVHSEKLYPCKQCCKSFRVNKSLSHHVKSAHLGVRYKCSECSKSFIQSWSRTLHCRSVHRNEKHSCEHCGKSFSAKYYLRRHLQLAHGSVSCSNSYSFTERVENDGQFQQ